MRPRFAKYLTRVHKWAGLVLGVQIFLWFASGFFMTLFPIDAVRGSHLAEQTPVPLVQSELISISRATALYAGDVFSAELLMVAGAPTYRLIGSGDDMFVNARTGQLAQPPNEAAMRAEAMGVYKGSGEISTIRLMDAAPREYGGALPVWQVQFDDRAKTRLYLSAQTAELKSVRTRLWRAFDLAWKFHIINPKGDDFSTWWLSLASGLAALFALSGFGLLWHRFVSRRRLRRIRN